MARSYGNAADRAQILCQQLVGLPLDPAGDLVIGRTAVGRIVLEAAVLRRIMRGRDYDAVGQPALASAIVGQDRMRDDRRRRISQMAIDHHLDAVGGQYFEGADKGRLRKRMRVHPHEKWTVDQVLLAIEANCLGDGRNVGLIEAALESGASMPRGPECDPLRGDRWVWTLRIVRSHQPRNVDQHRKRRRLSRQRAYSHDSALMIPITPHRLRVSPGQRLLLVENLARQPRRRRVSAIFAAGN
jgi:hypothetical protein